MSSNEIQENTTILQRYIDKIKESILRYTAFGMSSAANYNYELLIAKSLDKSIDSLGRYPTGGRSVGEINHNTIVFRATFNEKDIQFFKAILAGKKDAQILPPNTHFPSNGKKIIESYRAIVCNYLATEIISSKLILFLNACGQLKQVIAFTDVDREILLRKACEISSPETHYMIDNQLGTGVGLVHYDAYQESVKSTHERFANPKYTVTPKTLSLAKQISAHVKEHGLPIHNDEVIIIEAMKAAITALSTRYHLDIYDGVKKLTKLTNYLTLYQTATTKDQADDAIRDFVLTSARQRNSKWLSLFTSKYAETKSFVTFYEHLTTKASKTQVHLIFGYKPPVGTSSADGFANHLRKQAPSPTTPQYPSSH